MFPFFRWFPNFSRSQRDRQHRTSEYVYPEYPRPVQDQQQWYRPQGQYPVYPNTSDHVNPGAWNGYAPHPSQANQVTHPSHAYGQYQSQQYRQAQDRRLPANYPQPQPRIPPQPHTGQAVHASYHNNVNGNSNSNPNLNDHDRHRRHGYYQARLQDNRYPGFPPDANTSFNHSQPHLTPHSVQPSTQQAWTPFSNVSSSSHHQIYNPQTPITRRNRSRSQDSGTRVQTAGNTPRAASKSSSSQAPQIRSRMLKLPLIHPLVCGHRHSLIPDQIPETEVGKPVRSVWESQHFSLPQGSQVPMMIDAVQVRSLGIDWDITLPPSFAKEVGRDGQVISTPPRHLHLPLIRANFKSEVCIKTRQDNPLTECFLRWGCIVVEPRDPNGMPPTMKQFLYDIWDYFNTKLTEDECRSFSRHDLAKLHQAVEERVEKYAREGESSLAIRARGPTRRDVLWGYTRFAGLEVCPRFADTGDLFLYLEQL